MKTTEYIAREAQQAFWAKVAELTPEAEGGDFTPDESARFDAACDHAVAVWVEMNVNVGREEVLALAQAAGYYVEGTGGGCEALRKTLSRDRFVWITEECEVPSSVNAKVQVGFYNLDEGNPAACFECENLAAAFKLVSSDIT